MRRYLFLALTDVSREDWTGQSIFIMAVIGSDSNNYVFGLVQASSEPSQSSS